MTEPGTGDILTSLPDPPERFDIAQGSPAADRVLAGLMRRILRNPEGVSWETWGGNQELVYLVTPGTRLMMTAVEQHVVKREQPEPIRRWGFR